MVLLPTRSSTASICLASAMRFERSGPFEFDALGAELLQHGEALAAARGRDDPRAGVDRHLERGLAEGGRRAADDQRLPFVDLQIAEQAGPGGRVGLGDRGELGPGQVGLDQRDIRRPARGYIRHSCR